MIADLLALERAARDDWYKTQSPAAFDAWQDALCDRMDAERAAERADGPIRVKIRPAAAGVCPKCGRKPKGGLHVMARDDGPPVCKRCFRERFKLLDPLPVESGLFTEAA